MNFTADAIIKCLVILLVAVILIWLVAQFVPLLGLPGVVVTLLNLVVGVGALIAILKALGLIS